jgi:pimeloyl-ACP methyl ester carboxylesterase
VLLVVGAIALNFAFQIGDRVFLIGESSRKADPAHFGAFVRREFSDGHGTTHRYVIFVPSAVQPVSRLPVLMFLNGLGENGDDGLKQISNNFGLQVWESREQFPLLAIAPQCRIGENWNPHSQFTRVALRILDQVIEEFDADLNRVYLTGVSSGAGGVWNIATAYPDRFAAILPLCGVGGDAQKLSAARMPIWNVYNDGDAADLVDSNRALRRRLIEHGNSPLVTEYHAGGHDSWNRAYRTTAMYGWLLEQSRLKNQQAGVFQYFPPIRLLTEWHRSTDGAWEIADEDVIIGHGSETGGRCELTSKAFGSAIELHGDVWLQNETECRIGFLAQDSAAESWWVSVVTTDQGTGGLMSESGEWLSGLDPAAQNTLRTGAWNDVRVQFADERITVRLNGWPALDIGMNSKEASGASVKYRCALATPENDSEIRWRFIRTRFAETPPAEQDHQ